MSLSRYRAWDKENSRMVYPSTNDIYFELTDDGINILDMSVEPFDDVFPHLDAVLMQYTGLKDKNGVEIYEGDIYRYEYLTGSGVEYRNSVVEWETTEVAYTGVFHGYELNNYEIEVIGNIYENPELLSSGIE